METLINLRPKTEFEKLLFCEQYIAVLKESLKLERIERGKLASEVDHLNAQLRKANNKIAEYEQYTKADRNRIREQSLYKKQHEDIIGLQRTIRTMRQDRDVLLSKLTKYEQY